MNLVHRSGLILALAAPCIVAAAQQTAPNARPGYILPDGTIRIVGATATRGIIEKLNTLYAEKHPGTRFRFEPADNNAAIDALIFDATPFASLSTVYGGGIAYSDIVKSPPFSIRIAHASLSPAAALSPLAVIVQPSNPIDHLTIADLASIFAKQARARVIPVWSQLGAVLPPVANNIQPAGLPWSDHYPSADRAFGDDVFFRKFNAAAPVDNYRMFQTYPEVIDFVSHNPGAIGIVPINQLTAEVKAITLVDGPFATSYQPDAAGLRTGHYPFDRFLYLKARLQSGKPLDSLARDYLLLALSPEGQAAIAAEGEGYIPLNSLELAEEKDKLNEPKP